MTPEHFTEAHSLHALFQAADARGFPAAWADLWLDAGLADAFAVDRAWLEGAGRRLEAAVRGERDGRDDRLQGVMNWLNTEAMGGAYQEAAKFFLAEVVVPMHAAVAREEVTQGRLPSGRGARAFGAAIEAIRIMQEQTRARGQELDLAELDLQPIAEAVAWFALPGEGISVSDVLNAIKDHTAVVPLAGWVGDATRSERAEWARADAEFREACRALGAAGRAMRRGAWPTGSA